MHTKDTFPNKVWPIPSPEFSPYPSSTAFFSVVLMVFRISIFRTSTLPSLTLLGLIFGIRMGAISSKDTMDLLLVGSRPCVLLLQVPRAWCPGTGRASENKQVSRQSPNVSTPTACSSTALLSGLLGHTQVITNYCLQSHRHTQAGLALRPKFHGGRCLPWCPGPTHPAPARLCPGSEAPGSFWASLRLSLELPTEFLSLYFFHHHL